MVLSSSPQKQHPHPGNSGGCGPEYGQAIEILSEICRDPQVPKSVKKRIEDVVFRLGATDRTLQVKINSCTYLLDDVSNDPSVPPHTRTFIWQVAGLLEAAGKRIQLKTAASSASPAAAPATPTHSTPSVPAATK